MSYRLNHVALFVSDMPRALEFCRDVLGMSDIVTSPEFPDYAELIRGETTLALEKVGDDWPDAKQAVGRRTGVTLTVSDIEGTYHSLSAKGVRFSGPPTKQPWGGIMTSFFDPDGNEIGLLGEMPR